MPAQFSTVWGTGEKGAEAWWSQGCRTLDDLRGRDDLSAQQVMLVCSLKLELPTYLKSVLHHIKTARAPKQAGGTGFGMYIARWYMKP